MLLFLVACGSDQPAWAVHHASLIPGATGATGTQTWEFFNAEWADSRSDADFVCARVQTVVAEVVSTPDGCEGCTASYQLTTSELDTDCPAPFDTDAAYATGVTTIGIGDVPDELVDVDPYPGRSLGWYVSEDGGATLTPYGHAWEEALDWAGALGAPGWATGQVYTLWPAYAWDLQG